MRLVHLARASLERGIRRAGLVGAKATIQDDTGAPLAVPRAVFAMPVVRDSWTTFQWLRELRRGHDERMIAVYFHVPDDELVRVGRFYQPHALLSAAAAAAWVTRHPAGAQIVVPHAIRAAHIRAIRQVGQLVGWTVRPEQSRASCLCQACFPRGDRHFMRRMRAAYAAGIARVRSARSEQDVLAALGDLDMPFERAGARLDATKLLTLAGSPDARIRRSVARLFRDGRADQVQAALMTLVQDRDAAVQEDAVNSLMRVAGLQHAAAQLVECGDHGAVAQFIALLEYERATPAVARALEQCAQLDPSLRPAVAAMARIHLEEATGSAALVRRLARLAT